MAVYCYMTDCKNRSSRKSKHKNNAGQPLYRCLLNNIIVDEHANVDVTGEECEDNKMNNMSYCMSYRPKEDIN